MRSILVLTFVVPAVTTLAIRKVEQAPAAPSTVHPDKSVFLDGHLCSFCKDLINDTEKAGEGEIKEWLEEKIDHMCQHLGSFAKECNQIRDGLVELMVNLINEDIRADAVWAKIHLYL